MRASLPLATRLAIRCPGIALVAFAVTVHLIGAGRDSAALAQADEPAGDAKAVAAVDYGRNVLPILAKHCQRCHGPDKQESELRLDRRQSMLRGGTSGEPAVVPGNSGESYLVRLVSGDDPDRVMPAEGDRLSSQEIQILRDWIDQGAKWPTAADGHTDDVATDFWSLEPIRSVHPPETRDPWVTNTVDAFVLDRLRNAGLGPSPPAERRHLIRRVYLDVLGLPPSPEDVGEFVNDERDDAYPRLVERVLASPHYGERWARHWLDVVRFAETHGFEKNVERPNAYHYRDYVIEAFNADKPFNRFVVEQLAGDALGVDAATGFLVGGPYDEVTSPDVSLTLMQRQDELADMINTTGTAFLGLTLGCAKCHNHKFDPVLQRDFYAIQAVFAGVRHGQRRLRGSEDDVRLGRLAEVTEDIGSVTAKLHVLGVRPPVQTRVNAESFEPVVAQHVRFSITATNCGSEPCLDELEIYAVSPAGQPPRNIALAGAGAKATASGTLPDIDIHKLAHINDGRYGNARSWISNEKGRGWVEIELVEPTEINRIDWGRDREEKYSDRLATEYVIEVSSHGEQWQTVATSRDRLSLPLSGELGRGLAITKPVTLPQPLPKREGSFEAPLAKSEASVETASRRLPEAEQLVAELHELEREQVELLAAEPLVYAGRFEDPTPTHRLYRGDPLSPREVILPDTLSVLGTLSLDADTSEPDRRVALANWIADDANPLTSRVIANRVWQHHFGTGLVDTPSDFGRNGSRPSHPELLDWLARELILHDWSLKHLHRLILLSSTYRQSSAPHEEGLRADADTRLLWRFPPRRLEAEAIRDSILATSGVLDPRMHGPGFSAFEPNQNYVRVYSPKEEYGPDGWRRMVYMHKVRMERDAVFGGFDCPDAGQVAPKRTTSTTAIQALNLFNSRFTLRQAELFAERVRREAGDRPEAECRRAFVLAFGREADAEELTAAQRLVETHGLVALCRALFNANEFLFLQ